MATLSPKGRIDDAAVAAEIARLGSRWAPGDGGDDGLALLLSDEALEAIDPFDRVLLAAVVAACRRCRSLSVAGRVLFSASRARRSSAIVADRLRKYLARFGLAWGNL